MTPIKSNRAPLTKRISVLALTAAAAFSFAVLSSEAQANHVTGIKPSKEYIALNTALKGIDPNATVETASPTLLAQAVTQAISAQPTYKPGNIAGEALKHSSHEDAGANIEVALTDAAVDDVAAMADAIKRAGSGKDLNVRLVPGFVAAYLPNVGDNSAALTLAKKVIASKSGAGAVIGGRALDLANTSPGTAQTDIEALVNQALAKTAGISAAAQDITKYAVAQLEDVGGNSATLAVHVSEANISLAQKVSVGAVAGDPLNGGPIIDAVLSDSLLPKLKTGVAPLVKGAAAVADIEEISHIAYAVGKQIGTASGAKTAIPFAKATSVVKTLASAIVAKSTSADSTRNSIDNKEDEIAEVAAFMVGQILNANTINGVPPGKGQINTKSAGPKIFSLVLAAVNVAKATKVQAANPGLYGNLTVDVVASVAETLGALRDATDNNIIPDSFFDGIKTFLRSKAKTIAGKVGNQTTIETAIDDAYASGAHPLFEDGTIVNNATTADPETDFRPF
jgi:hypothetical protein